MGSLLDETRLWESSAANSGTMVFGGVNIYAFDVDETLEVSGGPILLADLISLREEGHCIGICGNWGVACQQIVGWHSLFSFLGPLSVHHGIAFPKASFLIELKTYIPADDYVLVGNDPVQFGTSQDKVQANLATWRFIREQEFAAGQR